MPDAPVWAVGRVTPGGVSLLGTSFGVGEAQFATSAHIIGGDDRELVLVPPRADLSEYQDTSRLDISTIKAGLAAIDPVRDVCVLQAEGLRLGGWLALGDADAMPPGAEVVTLSYPHAEHGRFVLTRQDTRVGARVLIESAGVETKHLILNVQSRPGQSGAPVISAADLRVGAVVIGSYAPGGGGGISLGGIDPQTLHQTTHAVSAEYLLRMLS